MQRESLAGEFLTLFHNMGNNARLVLGRNREVFRKNPPRETPRRRFAHEFHRQLTPPSSFADEAETESCRSLSKSETPRQLREKSIVARSITARNTEHPFDILSHDEDSSQRLTQGSGTDAACFVSPRLSRTRKDEEARNRQL